MRRFSVILCTMLFTTFCMQASKLLNIPTSLTQAESEIPNVAAIETSGGKVYYYALTSKPTLKYIDTDIVIATNEGSFSLKKSDVKELNFVYMEEFPSGIDDLQNSGMITYKHQILSVSGYSPHTALSVYSTDGRLMLKVFVSNDGTAATNLSTLPSGIYIINVGDDNIKITK